MRFVMTVIVEVAAYEVFEVCPRRRRAKHDREDANRQESKREFEYRGHNYRSSFS